MELISPPTALPRAFKDKPAFFLAGSCDGEDWRAVVTQSLEGYACTVLNPVNGDPRVWNRQSADNPLFKEQVIWELEGQERVHHILMYFHPATKAPITLLEFGLGIMGAGGELVVCCPEGFYRKGNVDVVCQRYDVPQVPGLNGLVQYAIEEIKRWEKTHAGSIERRLNG